ncbi:unnamed protein product [Bursaphelenchus xylophilus]|uniref:dUTP diphosphatase n=1 Tax=Bursaphelenchus xylophilus TaxID=6326 RepID=A0A1I7RHQ9_BURXY|nr:unnamed protein product [Bursaphelenchus xylophilus]CAG9115481.1 unnamed protein product [Bursaphelenchus xylophilus]
MVLAEVQNEVQTVSDSPVLKKQKLEELSRFRCKVALTNSEARIPTYGSAKAAGMDLYSCEEVVIPARGKSLVSTGIKMEFPAEHYGWVAPRSGLAVKNGIHIGAGVIDEDYRGEIKICLYNFSNNEFKVNIGDRIAQQVLIKYTQNHSEDPEIRTDHVTKVTLIDGKAKTPEKKDNSPAFIIYSSTEVVIPPRGQSLVSTGLKMEIPEGFYVRIAALYGLASEHHIQAGAGVIDEDYRGEIKVCLFNHGEEEFKINVGDSIAQFVLEEYTQTRFEKVEESELEATERGTGGFGSTGVATEEKKSLYGSPKAAGLDLVSSQETVVPAKGKAVAVTDFKTSFPSGYYGRICPRSGLAVKNFIDVGAGVLHLTEEPINVVLFNHGDTEFKVNVGDRIAQLVMIKTCQSKLVNVSEEDLGKTDRGEGGFGSTGVSSNV